MLAPGTIDEVHVCLRFRSDPGADKLSFCLADLRSEIGGALHVEVVGGGFARVDFRGGDLMLPLPEAMQGGPDALGACLERAGYRVERHCRSLVGWYVAGAVMAGEASLAGEGMKSVSSAVLVPKSSAGGAGAGPSAGRVLQ